MRDAAITVAIDGIWRADQAALFRTLGQLFPQLYPRDLEIKLEAAAYRGLRANVQRQAERPDNRNAKDQLRAIGFADAQLRTTETWSGRILVEIGRRYGFHNASRACCYFIAHRLLETMTQLARYQLADEPPISFVEQRYIDHDHEQASRTLLVYSKKELLELILRDKKEKSYTRVYVPRGVVDNSDDHVLYAMIEDQVRVIPLDIWIDYVIPQCAAEQANEISGYFHWAPEPDTTFMTEAVVWAWRGGKLSGRTQLLTPPHIVEISGGRASGEDAKCYMRSEIDPPAISIGPLTFLPGGYDEAVATVQTEELRRVVKQVNGREWVAPSVWHAVAWLLDLVGWDRKKRPRQAFSEDSELGKMPPGAMLFRGQADSSWALVPSIHRNENVADRRAGDRLMFALMYLQYMAEGVTHCYQSQFAVAQHYGIPTHLLDFTLDPRVAAYFAVDNAETVKGNEAAIYWMPLQTAHNLGGMIILAPHWVERIYRQRGCFVDMEHLQVKTRVGDLKPHCFSIRFPRDPAYLKSDLSGLPQGVYPESAWLEKAVRWAREATIYIDNDGTKETNKFIFQRYADDLVGYAGQPPFAVQSMDPKFVTRQIDFMIETIEWLALELANVHEGNVSLHMDTTVIALLAQDNPGVFASIRAAGSWMRAEKCKGARGRHFDYLMAILDSLDYLDEQAASARSEPNSRNSSSDWAPR